MIEDDAQTMLELAREGADLLRDAQPALPYEERAEWLRRRGELIEEIGHLSGYRFN